MAFDGNVVFFFGSFLFVCLFVCLFVSLIGIGTGWGPQLSFGMQKAFWAQGLGNLEGLLGEI